MVSNGRGPLIGSRAGAWTLRHGPPVAATVATLVIGMNYVIMWVGVTTGSFVFWLAPSDLWGTYLSSLHLVQGHLSQSFAAYPGILLLFAPVAALGNALHLEVGPQYAAFAAPTGWVLVGPFELLIASVPLFSIDEIAKRFGVGTRQRFALAFMEAVVLSNVTIKWGHPEDALAVGLALFAALDADARRWNRCGWLLGAAIAVQPLAVLALPALVTVAAVNGARHGVGVGVRAVIPMAAIEIPALIVDWHQLSYWLLNQPNYPAFNHATPWTPLAHPLLYYGFGAIAEGPSRLIAIGCVLVLSIAVCRRHHRLEDVVYVLAASFVLRVAFESVVDSYYVWPVLALGLVLAARRGWAWFLASSAVAVFATWFSNLQWRGDWSWWSVMMVLLVALLALGWPTRTGGDGGTETLGERGATAPSLSPVPG